MIWSCPKCKEPLVEQGVSLSCVNNHCYDRAKQGYYNLLLANQKNSLQPGDSDAMIVARRDFLRAGYYQPLVNRLAEIAEEHVSFSGTGFSMLDLGCGEGYYLENFAQALGRKQNAPVQHYFGVDISKDAVRRASASANSMQKEASEKSAQYFHYAVASNLHLPLVAEKLDLCLNVFAPMDLTEVQRVLSAQGLLVRVQPGPRHLYEIKQALYGDVRLHQRTEIEPQLKLIARYSTAFKIQLPSATAIGSLLTMTPLNWHGDREAKEQLLQKNALEVEIDFDVQVLAKSRTHNWW
ncbi:putative RNA methyltransferase [Teredinibacter franksiae]|uniref:putative RNA methyltransferase n=1 Tax=Teredinibacter franksiae TaxID=2761453 RepID=UPI00162A7F6C|nr:methyltransferase domain-containing protein [Teredinibacter franksiae]